MSFGNQNMISVSKHCKKHCIHSNHAMFELANISELSRENRGMYRYIGVKEGMCGIKDIPLINLSTPQSFHPCVCLHLIPPPSNSCILNSCLRCGCLVGNHMDLHGPAGALCKGPCVHLPPIPKDLHQGNPKQGVLVRKHKPE